MNDCCVIFCVSVFYYLLFFAHIVLWTLQRSTNVSKKKVELQRGVIILYFAWNKDRTYGAENYKGNWP